MIDNWKRFYTLVLILSFFYILKIDVCAADPITSSRCNEFTFDATGSYDPDNEDISFRWDFGDGQSSTQSVVSHTYQQSGDYDVTLSITDNSGMECSTATNTQTVRVNLPPSANINAVNNVCVNQPFNVDGSASYDDSSSQMSYFWDFGDGTKSSGQAVVNKTYSRGGDYKISLTVNDNSGTVCSTDSLEQLIHVNEPPIANAGEDTILKCIDGNQEMTVTFDGSQSSDVNNDTLTYIWDFGDGERGQGPKVSHQYSSLGNYDVKLVVKDNSNLGCGASVDFVTVRLNKMPVAKAGEDAVACTGDEIAFDGTQSYAFKKGTISAKWTFGDGRSSEGLITSHRYLKPGKYQATLSVENELNSMCPPAQDTKIVTINSTPTVSLKVSPTACLGNAVTFTASGSDPDGDTLEYYWSFGDGTILRGGPQVSHDYKQGGQYKVSVIVDDGHGSACSTSTAEASIHVNTPPIADAGPNLSCCVGKNTAFDGATSSDPDGDLLTYTWDFGDGTTARGQKVNHSYEKSGSYNVRLTVDDSRGTSCSQASSGYVAQVNASPVPVFNIR